MSTSDKNPIVVIAVGGNALAPEGGGTTIPEQAMAAANAAQHIANAALQGWRVVLTHGNGPQVGDILRRSELASAEVPSVPMDYATAETQGEIGIMFQKSLLNELHKRGSELNVATIITQVVIDEKDPAFQSPSKPIGSVMNEATARKMQKENGWSIMEEIGRGWRRCVPSPQPQEVIEAKTIGALLENNHIVIACGGGGIPVTRDANGNLHNCEAVIDKDLASALLAQQLGARRLLIATAVPKVAINFGKSDEKWLDHLSIEEAQLYMQHGHFGKGSMGPKVEAVLNYVQHSQHHEGIITDIEHIGDALAGKAGTKIGG